MANFIGRPALGRDQVVKRIWEYVKEQGLKDPRDDRVILCDKILEPILGEKTTYSGLILFTNNEGMIETLSAHIGKLAEDQPSLPADTKLYSDSESDTSSQGYRTFMGTGNAIKKRDSMLQLSETDDYYDDGSGEWVGKRVKKKQRVRRSRVVHQDSEFEESSMDEVKNGA